jgi:hypothetical protein
MLEAETIISLGVIVVMKRAGQGPRRNLVRLSLQPQVELWLELTKHIPAITPRQ